MNAYSKAWLEEWRSKATAKARENVGMSIGPNHGWRNAINPQLEIPNAADECKYIPRFIGIEDVVALWDEIGSFPQTRLGHIINSNEPALIMVDELGSYLSASDERRAWAKKFVLKCWRKPRLRYASARVDSRVGWWVDELVRVLDWSVEGQAAPSCETPPTKTRSNPMRAFLQQCLKLGLTSIDDIWLHIKATATDKGPVFLRVSKDTATTVDGEKVEKKNLARQLTNLQKTNKAPIGNK